MVKTLNTNISFDQSQSTRRLPKNLFQIPNIYMRSEEMSLCSFLYSFYICMYIDCKIVKKFSMPHIPLGMYARSRHMFCKNISSFSFFSNPTSQNSYNSLRFDWSYLWAIYDEAVTNRSENISFWTIEFLGKAEILCQVGHQSELLMFIFCFGLFEFNKTDYVWELFILGNDG